MNNTEKIKTDYVGHHISSGGFIFYKDTITSDIYTLLITNKKNELWIVKGHIEKNENHIDTAFREFEEEVGMKRNMLAYVDFLTKIQYSFNEWGGNNTKEVYMHIFESKEKYDLSGNTGVEDIVKIEWYKIDDALASISFNKVELADAVEVFESPNKKGVKVVQVDIDDIREKLLLTSFADKITSFIVYGSSVNNQSHLRQSNDTDMCIVLNDRDVNLKELSRFLYGNFDNPDFVIYFEDEVESHLPFRDTGVGSFCIEFFANGVLVYGKNIFTDKLLSLSHEEYKKSHLEKTFEYILRIRRGYHSKSMSGTEKLIFLNKYVTRLLRGIILYNGDATYLDLEQMEKEEIYSICQKLNIIKSASEIIFTDPESLYEVFESVNLYIVNKHSQ